MNDAQRFAVDLHAVSRLLDRRPDVTPHPLVAFLQQSAVAGV